MFNENNPLYRFYHEVINQKKFEVLGEIYAPGYVNRIAPFGLDSGVDGVERLIREQAAAFPDWHIKVDYVIEHGDKTIVSWTLTGTQTGEYFGYPPSGRAFEISGVDIETIVDGKITEHDGAEDMLSLLQQIGAVPLTFG